MAENARLGTIALKMVRLSFPKIWTPEASAEGGPLKYSAAFLIDPHTQSGKENIRAIEAEIAKVAKATWAEKAEKILKVLDKNRKAFLDGDLCTNAEGDIYDGYDGMMVVKAANKKRFKTINRDKSVIVESDDILYGGCYVDAIVSFYSITDQKRGGNGIFATLELIRFRKDGEAFGAGPVNEDDYLDDLEDEEDDELV